MGRFLLIVIVGILFFRLLFRYVVPWLLKRKLNKMEDEYKRKQNYQHRENKSEGEVSIEQIPKDQKKKKKMQDDEDYADYEEVD